MGRHSLKSDSVAITIVIGVLALLTSMTLAFIASHNSGDALEKFGAAQQDIAAQKEKEKERALGSGAGMTNGSASGSAFVVPASSSMGAPDINDTHPAGSAAPTTGDTPILGSGFAPGPATHPTPTPNGTGAANPPAQNPAPTTTDPNAPKKPAPSTPAPAPTAPAATTSGSAAK